MTDKPHNLQAINMTETGKQGGGLDPSRMLDIMADLECALVMTREHDPTETVGGFVDCSIQFKRLADFLHSVQHLQAINVVPADDDLVEWAKQTLAGARDGKHDLRDLGQAMNGKWDQDLPAAMLARLLGLSNDDDLTEGLQLDAEMLSGGWQENLTELWHSDVVKGAAEDCLKAATKIASLSSELAQCRNALEEARDRLEPLALLAGGDVNMHDPLSKWFRVGQLHDAREALATIDAALNPIGERDD